MGEAKTAADKNATGKSSRHTSAKKTATSENHDGERVDVRSAGNFAVQQLLNSGAIQASLKVGPLGDAYELEADQMAERVLSSAPPETVQRKCSCDAGASCSECSEQVQAKPKQGSHSSSAAGSTVEGLRGGGRPLPSSVRNFFEPRFGQDFSAVRLHTDDNAIESANSINARAYTAQEDIVFGAGEYAPESAAGQRLLAHELAHVLQQRNRHDGGEPVAQRQPSGEPEQTPPVKIPIEVEYTAHDPYGEEERSSIYPAMLTGGSHSLGFWTNPPGSSFKDYFTPAWARQRSFSQPLGQQANGDWLLERYAGRTSTSSGPRSSSSVTEFFGFDLREQMFPRSLITGEQAGNFATYTKLTPLEIARIPDILSRVNSGGKLSFTAAELDLLHRAAKAHGDFGMTGGSPFLSATSKPGLSTELAATPKKFLSGRPYVVRFRVPNSAVFEMSKLPGRMPSLVPEQEMLVTADLRGRIVAVQPNPTSSLARGEPFMRWGGRAFLAFGLGVSAHRIATASDEDRGVVVLQEVATHGGGLVGGSLGAGGCVVAGIASGGVVLFACGVVGAFLGAEGANRLVAAPFLAADFLANGLPYLALQATEGLEMAGRIAGNLTETVAGGPYRAHAMMDPGNWDMRYFSPAIAPDVAAVGIAMWERLGPLGINEFSDEVTKPIGSFGVPVASMQRIAAFLSGPDQQYNASLPVLYASLGNSLPAAPVAPGINILEMKPHELIELLATRKLNFIQDPNYVGGFASRLEARPMDELHLKLLIEQRETIAEDNWSFPGKTHQQVRPLKYVGQLVWNQLKLMDENNFRNNVNRKLSTFGISDWALNDAARALDELSMFGTGVADLTEGERAERAVVLSERARELGEMTPEDFAYHLMDASGLVHIKHPGAEAKAAIERVRAGMQPW